MNMSVNLANLDAWLSTASEYLMHPIIMLILCLVSVFVVLGNLLVVSAIWHEHQLHSVTNYLIASLAAADCLVGAVVMPFSIISEIIIGSWTFGETWCDLWHSFDVLASTASIMNLCAISLDRYLAITDPISYPSRMTSKRVALLIVSLWTCSSLISFPAILWWRAVGQGPLEPMISRELSPRPSAPKQTKISTTNSTSIDIMEMDQIDHPSAEMKPQFKCVFTDDPYYLLFSSFISFYGPLCVMLYAYYRIYKAAVQQTRFLKHGSKQVKIGGNKKKKRSRNLSDRSSCGNSLRSKPVETSCGGTSNMESYDRQLLVLRAHRGGGGGSQSSNSMRKGSVGEMNKSKLKGANSSERKRENIDLEAATTNCNQDQKENGTKRGFENDSQHDRQVGSNKASNYSNTKQHMLKIKSQRFDSNPSDRLPAHSDIALDTISRLRNERPCDEASQIESKAEIRNARLKDGVETSLRFKQRGEPEAIAQQSKKLRAKPLFAFINRRAASVDVSTNRSKSQSSTFPRRYSAKPDKSVKDQSCLDHTKASQYQEDSSFITIKEKESRLEVDDNTICDNSFDDETSDDVAESDSCSNISTNSSGSYGTGSIASVMIRPHYCQGQITDERRIHRAFKQNSNDNYAYDPRTRRALSVGEARKGNELAKTCPNNNETSTDVRQSKNCQGQNSFDSAVSNDRFDYRSQQHHRASCGDPVLSDRMSIPTLSFSNFKTSRTLNFRSWVKLSRSKPTTNSESCESELKPPPSLMPLIMMNSDTSTDSSTVSGATKTKAFARSDHSHRNLERNGRPQTVQAFKNNYVGNDGRGGNGSKRGAQVSIEISTPQPNKTGDIEANNEADGSRTGSNLAAKKESQQVSKSNEKGQMLYYDSNKLIQSIVDLSAIHYIDCANPKNPIRSAGSELKVANTKNNQPQNSRPTKDDHLEQDSEVVRNTVPRQNKSVGKKLSKLAKERKAAKTLGIVVGVFILCWLPFFVMNIVVALCGSNCIFRLQMIVPVITWLGWLNSAMNPVIYACWSRDFRRAFRRVLCSWVECVCPYERLNLARKLHLKKCSSYAHPGESRNVSSIRRGNTSSLTNKSLIIDPSDCRKNSPPLVNGGVTRGVLSDQTC